MKPALSSLVWIRHALGVAVIIGVVIVMLHLPKPVVLTASAALVDEGPMPDLDGAIGWLNSAPLNRKSLQGKVVLVDFWTYTCINSIRPLPYVKSWAAKYKDAGLVVIGAHTPEFSFEHEPMNVETAVRSLKVTFLWPSTAIIGFGGRLITKLGPPSISSTRKDEFATTTLGKATMAKSSASSRNS